MMTLNWQQALMDGVLFSGMMGGLILLSLVINPRLWLQDYPPEIRKLAPPLTQAEKRLQWIVLSPFVIGMFGIPYLIGRSMALSTDSVSFLMVFAHLWIVLNLFNLFDAVVLDVLFLGLMRPKFALIPEAWGRADLLNLRREAANWMKGMVFCLVGAAIIAAAVVLTIP